MKKLAVFLLAGIFSLNATACDGDDDDDDNDSDDGTLADPSAFPYSCHFLDPFNDKITHCVGYENVTSLDEATAWCNDNKLGCSIVAAGTAKEGGCKSVATESSGYCTIGDERCAITWGTLGEARAEDPKTDCDKEVQYSNAWGCEVPADGKFTCTLQ